MNKEKKLHCGIVAIVGRPNTGKSTLLNYILGEKVAIVSNVPQTTRQIIRGIFNDQRGQVVFVDTPGMFLSKHRLGSLMIRQIGQAIEGCDIIIHLVDTNDPPGKEERLLIDRIKYAKVPIILGLNKVDLKATFLDNYIKLWEEVKGKNITELTDKFVLMPLSALKGINVSKLIETIFAYLAEGPQLYPEEMLTDFPQKLAIAEIIRERLFQLMRKELPHSLAVYIDQMQPRLNKLMYIRAIILVERDSQKAIVIGKDGKSIKKVGQEARGEIEALLKKKVFLETQVKVNPGWRDDPQVLKQLGYI